MATEGIWAGGPGGLYRYDGRIFPGVEGLRDVPVSSIALDDDGKGAWVGTHSHGLYHAEGDHAAPVPGSEAILLDAVLGVGEDRRRHARRGRQRRRRGAALRADDGAASRDSTRPPARASSRWSIAAATRC